jgi:hypothetical protein
LELHFEQLIPHVRETAVVPVICIAEMLAYKAVEGCASIPLLIASGVREASANCTVEALENLSYGQQFAAPGIVNWICCSPNLGICANMGREIRRVS